MTTLAINRRITRPSIVGQLDYVDLTGQVVDQDGKGLQAVYFYIDLNSQPLSQEFTTPPMAGDPNEPAGTWNLYFPNNIDLNATFVNFAATADYQPVVKSLAELQSNPVVVLEKTTDQKTSYVLPLIGGGILALVLLQQPKRNVGALNIKERYNKLNPQTQKIILYAGGGLAAFLLIQYLLKYKPTPQQQAELDAAKNELQRLASVGILPSFSLAQFQSMANAIVAAVDDCGTDEDTIYRQFQFLKNDADLYELISVYGVGSYKGCFEGSYFGNVHRTLSETLTADMTTSQVEKINSILASKYIQYYF